MRELGLRAWSIKKHKFLNIDTLYCANGKVCAVVEDGVVNDIEDVVLEQDTELKDKNGEEIYEGDIVFAANYSTPFAVIYREGDCCFVANNEFLVDYIHLFKAHVQCYEVVGNIHENPELLEKEEG